MSPKDVALVAWSLGRLKIPRDQMLSKKLLKVIERNLREIRQQHYLFDAQGEHFDQTEDSDENPTPKENPNDTSAEPHITHQTIGMYYWGLSCIFTKSNKQAAFEIIVKFLVQRLEENGLPEANYSAGLRTGGVIGHACKYMRQLPLDDQHRRLIELVLDSRLALATRPNDPILLQADEFVHLKLLAVAISKEHVQQWHNESKQKVTHQLFSKVGRLLLTATQELNQKQLSSSKNLTEKSVKENKVITPLNMISNSVKKLGVCGNFSQILVSICNPIKKKDKTFEPLSYEEFELRRKLLKALGENTDQYSELKPRDLCDITKAVVMLRLQTGQINDKAGKFCEKQLRVLAKRCALAMGAMSQRSRETVLLSFGKIDFYDNDLVQALKKYKLVKGQDKK